MDRGVTVVPGGGISEDNIARVIASTELPPIPTETFDVQTEATNNEPIIRRESLTDGSRIDGPSIVQDRFCTISIGEHW